ncbi:hypothetical protein KQI84_09350 [bacterium]|nr:hypothetical protein [bacterium]
MVRHAILANDPNHCAPVEVLLDCLADGEAAFSIWGTKAVRRRLIEAGRADLHGIDWQLRDAGESVGSLLARFGEGAEPPDILWMIEAQEDLDAFAKFQPPCPSVLLIHNSAAWFANDGATFNPRERARRRARAEILSRQTALATLSPVLSQFIVERNRWEGAILDLPPALAAMDTARPDPTEGPLTIAVPGMIDPKRRDYDGLLDTIETLHARRPGKFHFPIIGAPIDESGRRIVMRAQSMQAAGMPLDCSGQYLHEPGLVARLAECHMVAAPLKDLFRRAKLRETYGRTKITGLAAYIVRTGLPGIFPEAAISPDDPLAPAMRGYTRTGGMAKLLLDLEANRAEVAALYARADEARASLTRDRVAPKLRQFAEELCGGVAGKA